VPDAEGLAVVNITCPEKTIGNKIRLTIHGTNKYLVICELVVFGEIMPPI